MNPELTAYSQRDTANVGFVAKRIPRFKEGGTSPLIFSASDMNVLVDAINRLLNMQLRRGGSDAIIHTDSSVIIQLAYASTGDLSAITAT